MHGLHDLCSLIVWRNNVREDNPRAALSTFALLCVLSAPIPMAKLRFINPSAEVSGEGAKITGHINAGLSSTSGNTQTKQFNLDTEAIIRARHSLHAGRPWRPYR